MIIERILDFFQNAIFTIFSFFNFPEVPQAISDTMSNFLDLIFTNISALGFFVRISTLQVVVPIVILIITIDKVYDLVMWILKKIPFVGVE